MQGIWCWCDGCFRVCACRCAHRFSTTHASMMYCAFELVPQRRTPSDYTAMSDAYILVSERIVNPAALTITAGLSHAQIVD